MSRGQTYRGGSPHSRSRCLVGHDVAARWAEPDGSCVQGVVGEGLLQPVLIFVHFDMLLESEHIGWVWAMAAFSAWMTLQSVTLAMCQVHVVTTAATMHIHASARVRGCSA